LPLRLVEKNIKHLRPAVMNYVVTPEEGACYSRLFFDAARNGIAINISHEYPFTAER